MERREKYRNSSDIENSLSVTLGRYGIYGTKKIYITNIREKDILEAY